MSQRTRHSAALGLVAIATALLCAATAAASGSAAPLPISDYAIRALCAAPAPEHAGCLSLELVPRTAAARAHDHPIGVARAVAQPAGRAARPGGKAAEGYFGLTPSILHTAYNLPSTGSSPQTIALVDAYNDPNAEKDLKAYSEEMGLPICTKENGCFKQLNQLGSEAPGSLPFPQTVKALEEARTSKSANAELEAEEAAEATGWGVEISLDIETAHAICESCHIALVEANSSGYEDLEAAETAAETLGATEISNSWGGSEHGELVETERKSPFNDPGTVITASAGDDGYLNWDSKYSAERGHTNFPASSPHVVAVGGTRLETNETTGAWQQESVWNGDGAGGGGCSEVFFAPAWQQITLGWSAVGCGGLRAVSDVSADADPYTGLAVHDSTPGAECEGTKASPGWCTIGGTSLASPLIASVFALAGGANGVEYPARTLYENKAKSPSSVHDITLGSNGKCTKPPTGEGLSGCTPAAEAAASGCTGKSICLAGVGYDGPSGVGTPDGLKAFEPTGEVELGKGEGEQPTGGSGGGSTGGGQVPGAGVAPIVSTPTTSPTPTPVPAPLQLSGLALTLNAIVALNNSHPKVSQIGFTFTINAQAIVRMTLAKRVKVHRHTRWSTIGHSATTSVSAGRNIWRLKGRGRLSAGLYRIMLTPTHATARSITFQIG